MEVPVRLHVAIGMTVAIWEGRRASWFVEKL